MAGGNPVSIVVTARNDNHGGNLIHRVQLFINGLFRMATKHQLELELVIVEWNPSDNEARLINAIDWSELNNYTAVKIIEVPNEVHIQYGNSHKLNLHQMIAKNVGIRRATHNYILATNIDILFSDELIRYISSVHLQEGTIYRTDRYDIKNGLRIEDSLETHMKYCFDNRTVHYGQHKIDIRYGMYFNACGDFQLMSKSDWNTLRGYPEFDVYPLHLDSILQLKAHQFGLKEQYLDWPSAVFHIEHEMSWTPDKRNEVAQKMNSNQVPLLSLLEAVQLCKYTGAEPINNENWGLFSSVLKITEVDCEGVRENNIEIQYQVVKKSVEFEDVIARSQSYPTCMALDALNICDWINRLARGNGYRHEGIERDRLLIFGTGSGYEQYIKPALEYLNVRPYRFVDNDKKKQGYLKDGVIIISPNQIRLDERDIIVIASEYYEEIGRQLEGIGFIEGIDFINGILPIGRLVLS